MQHHHHYRLKELHVVVVGGEALGESETPMSHL